jgi:hypothetical protein
MIGLFPPYSTLLDNFMVFVRSMMVSDRINYLRLNSDAKRLQYMKCRCACFHLVDDVDEYSGSL